MMAVMIPVYVLNALYLAPITVWTYIKYGRPVPLESEQKPSCHQKGNMESQEDRAPNLQQHRSNRHTGLDPGREGAHDNMSSHARMHHGSSDRPMFATITIAVCHCGAGCLLGDVVGEWLVYGAGISINRRSLWAEYLIDYGFALLFGIIFQYFSIAPMSGEWGPKTIWRAAKADFLSLTFFEIGLFGWMAISQTAIFEWQLRMDNVVYWWMMQIGMFLGHWTAFPINYWLIKTGVKESCA